jgi:LytS/YehU family sensor histidine kinase
MFIGLLNNLAILLALSILYSFVLRKYQRETTSCKIIAGLLFGAVTIIGMVNPVVFSPGIVFDGRSVIISIAGLFCGPVPATITALIAAIYRIWLGGADF